MGGAEGGQRSKIAVQFLDAFCSKSIDVDNDGRFTGCDDGKEYQVTNEDFLICVQKAYEFWNTIYEEVDECEDDFCEITIKAGDTWPLLIEAWNAAQQGLADRPV